MSQNSSKVLIFTPDDPRDCTILDQKTGKVVYKVSTELVPGSGSITSLQDSGGRVTASWAWSDFATDRQLTLGNNEPIATSDWLKKSSALFKGYISSSASFTVGKC
ncbi:hypothetical protein BKA70DRAFT_1268394 [Coprinopsis sp. MPI-PUGE-AT-0042]|nr:hypothetical protein BKA70DRAFT_1283641 [Coprinopsis sp. MPI-PUGE-AT-0042]KAH6911713.1 hypothetical protein BKA70DRAFT_1268394 [Coprinopsis sp. MPI-PUGE-AT-0042]